MEKLDAAMKELDLSVQIAVPIIKQERRFSEIRSHRAGAARNLAVREEWIVLSAAVNVIGALFADGALKRAAAPEHNVHYVRADYYYAVLEDCELHRLDHDSPLPSPADQHDVLREIETVDTWLQALSNDLQGMVDQGRLPSRDALTKAVECLRRNAETLAAAYAAPAVST